MTTAPATHPWYRLAFYAILIAAIGLRLHALDSQSLWLDELWAIEMACGHDADHQLIPVDQILNHPPGLTDLASARPVWQIWTHMDRITGPPGYHILLRGWMTMLGQTEISLRSFSVLFSVLGLILFFRAIKAVPGGEAALWAAAIFAVAGSQIHYAQDTRPYTLLIFETAAAVIAVQRISTAGPSNRKSVTLIFASLCLLLTHYFAVSVLIGVGGFALCRTTGKARNNILFCLTIASLVFAVIWGPMMWRQIPMFSTNDRAAAFLHDSATHHISQTFWRALAMPMSMLCDIRPIPAWYLIGGMVYLMGAYMLFRRRINWLWPMIYLSVIGLLVTLDLAHSTAHLAYIRYALLASPAVYVVIGASVTVHRNAGRAMCIAAVLFCLCTLPKVYSQTNEDFRSFGQAIDASTQKGDLIVFAGPANTYAPQILYLAASYYAWPLPGPVVLIQSPASAGLMAQLNGREHLWLAADPTVPSARIWLPGYHLIAGKSWPEVGSLLEMERDGEK